MKALIIDNEKEIRVGLRKLIEKFCPSIHEISEANGVATGWDSILHFKPDLVFLDMEMEDGTGLDLLKKFSEIDFQVIFVTAHDKYAIEAFRFSAVDFLQKPVDVDDLIKGVEKVKAHLKSKEFSKQFQVLLERINNLHPSDKKIVLRDNETIHFVKINDIIRCEADGPYTKFVFTENKPILISKSLKEFDDMLTPNGFIRCHHSHLVKISAISRFEKSNGGFLILDNKEEIPVSHRKKDQVIRILSEI